MLPHNKKEVVLLIYKLLRSPLSLIVFVFVFSLLAARASSIVASSSSELELLTKPLQLSQTNGAVEAYLSVPGGLDGKSLLRVTFDTHGTCLLGGDASALVFDQPNGTWRYTSLSRYGLNCHNGKQTVDIPLSHFPGLDTSKPVGKFHVRFWQSDTFTVDIASLKLVSGRTFGYRKPRVTTTPLPTKVVYTPAPTATPTLIPVNNPTPTATPTTPAPTLTATPTPTPTLTPAPTPTTTPSDGAGTWAIQSVSTMKVTKDAICGQRDRAFVEKWVDKAKELGANYIAVETPYENPACGNALDYTRTWVDVIRSRGLSVWHRHMPLAFEAIYDTPKVKGDYFGTISNYIKNNPTMFKAGDIFTPAPEPQNGGIGGVTNCSHGICQFDNASDFNKWLRDAIDISETAFSAIGLGGQMKIGYYGFDGFVAWGDNNPDWNGILEDSTVQKMGNITIDHYPDLVGSTMSQDLDELEARYPNVPIIIGEYGTAAGGDIESAARNALSGAKRPSVIGFNYWHMGVGGNEALINDDFSNRPQFDEVQSFFRP